MHRQTNSKFRQYRFQISYKICIILHNLLMKLLLLKKDFAKISIGHSQKHYSNHPSHISCDRSGITFLNRRNYNIQVHDIPIETTFINVLTLNNNPFIETMKSSRKYVNDQHSVRMFNQNTCAYFFSCDATTSSFKIIS